MDFVHKIEHYEEAIGLIDWDLHTKAPKKGRAQRSEVMGTLSEQAFNMMISPEMKDYLERLSDPDVKGKVSIITQKTVEYYQKEYERNHRIPGERYRAFKVAAANAGDAWEDAKKNDDFSLFLPHLKKIIAFKKEFLQYWGYDEHPYDTLLDEYEPGMTVKILDEVFAKLRGQLVELLQQVMDSPHRPDTDFIFQKFDARRQEAFHYVVLKAMGYDFDAGRLDETVHPFATGLNPGDVRVTTKYDEGDFRTSVFGTIHEGGHALYEQNIAPELIGTTMCTGTSYGIHESQSLFWENIVARNRYFWEHFYPELRKLNPDQFDGISLDQFYRGINVVQPSLIRIEADELTYCLHVMVRYEIEKALITDQIKAEDLPQIWNDKMEEYLGVRPDSDREGVLQDVHWSMGDFGYFPSYALGYIYSAQLKRAMDRDIPDFDQKLARGELSPIREWLTDKVHRHGKMKKPIEILQDVTGEGVNPQHLVDYLTEKYRNVYKLS
ncbi:MAG: carboxypeptidase M32 [Bacillaceae bacterium]|nr:carboxypeptidase M32 [Bacillaceae bacterium]